MFFLFWQLVYIFYVRPWKRKSHKSKRRVMPWRSSMKMRATSAFSIIIQNQGEFNSVVLFRGPQTHLLKCLYSFLWPRIEDNKFSVYGNILNVVQGNGRSCMRVSWFNSTGQFSFFWSIYQKIRILVLACLFTPFIFPLCAECWSNWKTLWHFSHILHIVVAPPSSNSERRLQWHGGIACLQVGCALHFFSPLNNRLMSLFI